MIFNLYKPRSISSNNFLSWFKKKFNIKKAGFYGTLDPLAQGVLPVFTGESTKLINFLRNEKKTYRFVLRLGWHSESLDAEGPITKISNTCSFQKEDILKILKNCCKPQPQIPPKYSAVKINGVRAYKLAKKWQNLDMSDKAKIVTLFNYTINSLTKDTIDISIECSPGYYVRSLAQHITTQLSTAGFVSDICRQNIDNLFAIKNSINVDELLKTGSLKELPALSWKKIFINDWIFEIKDEFLWEKICQGKNIDVGLGNLANFDHKRLNSFLKSTPDKNKVFFLNYAKTNSVCIGFLECSPDSQIYNFKPKKLLSYII